MALKLSVEVLFSVPEFKKAAMCHMENIGVLSEFYSVMGYSAAGHEFNVNESAIHME